MIVPMLRVRLAAPNQDIEPVIQELGRLGIFHISNPEEDPVFIHEDMTAGVVSKRTAAILSETDSLIASITTALDQLPHLDETIAPKSRYTVDFSKGVSPQAKEELHKLVERISAISADLDNVISERREVRMYHDLFMEFSSLIEVVASSEDVDLVGVAFPKDGQASMEKLEQALDEATDGVYTVFQSHTEGKDSLALVVVPVWLRDAVSEKVFARKTHPIHLPEQYRKETFASTLAELLDRDQALESDITRYKTLLYDIAKEWRGFLSAARQRLVKEAMPLHAQEKIIHTEDVFWLSGWVPADELAMLENSMEARFGDKVLVYAHLPSPDIWKSVPVKLANHWLVRPFERIVDLYAPPAYGSVDPVIFVAAVFPLFFGMILGDVGYAMILALLAWAGAKAAGPGALVRDIRTIVYWMASSSALFGLIYGEFFGDFWKKLGLYEPLFHRADEAGHMLALVLFIGLFHVAFGAVLGIVNGYRRSEYMEVAEKVADIFMLFALFWLGAATVAGAAVGLPALMLALAFGFKVMAGWSLKSALEAPKLMSNVLSYARLMALGLASVALADLANGFISSGSAVAGAAAGVAFHALNFVIGVVSPTIQSCRLHYVEFFSQFFEPAVERYRPLTES